jgi:hypothetical protein
MGRSGSGTTARVTEQAVRTPRRRLEYSAV